MTRRLIGTGMLVVLFAALFIGISIERGIGAACGTFMAVAVLMGFLYVAVSLLVGMPVLPGRRTKHPRKPT